MPVCVKQCAVGGEWKGGLEIVCCRIIEGGTTFLSAIVHSAAFVVYKRRQRGQREALGSSQDPLLTVLKKTIRKIHRRLRSSMLNKDSGSRV